MQLSITIKVLKNLKLHKTLLYKIIHIMFRLYFSHHQVNQDCLPESAVFSLQNIDDAGFTPRTRQFPASIPGSPDDG
jgi:hypothetical protein